MRFLSKNRQKNVPLTSVIMVGVNYKGHKNETQGLHENLQLQVPHLSNT